MHTDINAIISQYFQNVPVWPPSIGQAAAWTASPVLPACFEEPPLALTNGSLPAGIWLFSAAGAVGKSAFARELATRAGAIYVDLASAGPLGSLYLSGAINNAGLNNLAQAGRLALIIDALDEAFLKISFQARVAFFTELAAQAAANHFPTLVFGRPAAIEEATLILWEVKHTPANFAIRYFTKSQALNLVYKLVMRDLGISSSEQVDYPRKNILLERIREMLGALGQTARDDDGNFAGYAPVLEAVARYFSASQNFSLPPLDAQGKFKNLILEEICRYIMEREKEKIDAALKDAGILNASVYDPAEQMSALCQICQGKRPDTINFRVEGVAPQQMARCIAMAREHIQNHPFLSVRGHAANAVFAGAIQAYALKRGVNANSLFASEAAASPLLFQFYFNDDAIYNQEGEGAAGQYVPLAHLPFLLESLAALASGDWQVNCEIEDNDSGGADAYISRVKKDASEVRDTRRFRTDSAGRLTLRRLPCALDIDCHAMEVVFANKPSFTIAHDLFLNVNQIVFECSELAAIGDPLIHIQARDVESSVINVDDKHGKPEMYIHWPGSEVYPWSNYPQIEAITQLEDREMLDAFHSFRRLAIIFRANRNNAIAKLVDKIENRRISRKYGATIRDHMLACGALKRERHLYFMDTQKVAEVYDMNFENIRTGHMSQKLKGVLADIVRKNACI